MAQYQLQWPPFTANIKALAIGLFVLWFASVMVAPVGAFVDDYMLVSAPAVFAEFEVWTLVTYALWHADFMHLLFNVIILWMFGAEIDRQWSTTRWWRFNLLCALGGGVAVVLSQWILSTNHPTLGYSGAVMGVVAAFAWQNWNRRVNLFFFPMTGKTLLLVFVALDLFFVIAAREPISVAAHLGGMATGLLIVSNWWRPRRWKLAYNRYKHRQRRQQFQLLKKDPESDRYIN